MAQFTGTDDDEILPSLDEAGQTTGDDVIAALGGDDVAFGGSGDDIINGGAGGDVIIGGVLNVENNIGYTQLAGDDTADYSDSDAAVFIDLSIVGNYTVNLLGLQIGLTGAARGFGGHAQGDYLTGITNLTGSGFADFLSGDSLGNRFDGGDGDDVLQGGAGADLLIGGMGTDTAIYASALSGVIVDLSNPNNNSGDAAGDVFMGVENLSGSFHDDSLVGGDGANSLDGGDGNDTLEGKAGADDIDGGAGSDTASYVSSDAAIHVNMITNTHSGGHAAGDTLADIENLIGSAFNDYLVGDISNNVIDGGAGNDTINGSVGDDVLIGGAGDDEIAGSSGADFMDGGEGSDTASYFNSTGSINVNLLTGTTSGAHAVGDSFNSIENLRGSGFDDTLTGDNDVNLLMGGSGEDWLDGGFGDDELRGEQGNDWLMGSDGADWMNGGSGNDTADYSGSTAGVDARIGVTSNSGGQAEGDNLYGIENITGSAFDDVMVGSQLANTLTGGDGNDQLNGALNADILSGGLGDDMLIGGSGSDILDGGDGIDTANYFSSANGVAIDLLAGTATLGDASGDTLLSIENLLGSYIAGDSLTGDDGANRLEGFLGADRINGGAGNDVILLGNADGVRDFAIFNADGFGNDSIRQFEDGIDLLDIRGLGRSFDDVTAIQSDLSTIITFDGVDGQITLTNFSAINLDSDDFLFGSGPAM